MADFNDIPPGTPAAAPPPGIAPNYDDPRSMSPSFVVLGIFLSLALGAVLIRVFVRFRFTKTWGWDDCKFHERVYFLFTNIHIAYRYVYHSCCNDSLTF